MTAVSNNDDVIDSRDVIDRIAELENDPDGSTDDLDALRKLAEQGSLIEDWEYGATLVRHDYFVTYAQELAAELDAVPSDPPWPLGYIDWESAAEALLDDYTPVEFDGVTYYAR